MMEKEEVQHPAKRPRVSLRISRAVQDIPFRSPVIENFPLPSLLAEMGNVWEEKTSVAEVAANVEAKFHQGHFIQEHPFINIVAPATPQEITQVSSLFKRRPDRTSGVDIYNRFRGSTFNTNYSILNFGMAENSTFRLGKKEFRNELYVRKCYWQLFYLIELLIRIRTNQNYKANFIVTGTSGIGKTYFSLFYMTLAAKRGKIFLHQDSAESITLYGPGFRLVKRIYEMGEWLNKNLLPDNKIDYYFFDPSVVIEPEEEFVSMSTSSIAIASPNKDRFKSFSSHCGAGILVMKMPSEEEILEMRNSLPAFRNINNEKLRKQLSYYGPVPRFVLEDAWRDLTELELAFNEIRLTFLRKVLLGETNIESGDDKQVSYHLIHINSSDFSFVERFYTFASMYVVDQVAEKSKHILSSALLDWITHPRKAFAAAVGNLFDVYGHQLFIIGKNFTVNPLPHADRRYGDDVVQSPDPPLEPFNLSVPEEWQSLPTWDNIRKSIYYIHNHVNMESADCFFINDNILYILQFTVASKHSIKGAGLSNLITRVQEQFSDVSRSMFIFVSPDNMNCINSIQPFHVPGSKKNYSSLLHIPENIRAANIHNSQYILKIAQHVFEEVNASVDD